MARKLAALIAVVGGMLVATTPVHADSGFCGVRVEGPTYAGSGQFAYTIRNKCRHRHRFAIRVYGRRSRCRRVDPHAHATYLSSGADPNWRIVNC